MKCTEVIEWMHRYLDHDLSPDETIEMYRHIDNCPSCAEVFNRLTLLSEQLEQLPDVKPPFSLVDSIMPQLEKIDLGVQAEDAAASEDTKVIPMTRKGTHSQTVKGTSRVASMAARTGIGAVAAAIILVIALFNMPDSMPAADVEQALNQAADTAGSNEAMSKMTTGNSDTAATEGADNAAAPDELNAQLSESAGASDGGTVDGGAADSAAPATIDAGPAAEATEAGPAVSEGPASAKRSTSVTRNSELATPAPRSDIKSGGGNMSAQDARTFNDEDTAADNSAPAQDVEQTPAAEEAGTMGLLPMLKAQSPWYSPDGKYSAELAGQQLVIYNVPSSGLQEERTAVTSLPLEGTWVSGTWSEDSLQFTYVTLKDGSEVSKVYNVPDAGAAGAPSASPDASATALPGNK
ncbi:anti-sigma factor family protein [Paenibacillus pedocola]|uniref:anti-sigma factor family protein n=1 Tax=Paenibacillus pedocola TaxID=3242193 RepID=UPI0028776FD0|nr:zf-HC2 domain-containing protein [Paenibacillus typhae]